MIKRLASRRLMEPVQIANLMKVKYSIPLQRTTWTIIQENSSFLLRLPNSMNRETFRSENLSNLIFIVKDNSIQTTAHILCSWSWIGFGFISVLSCGNMKRFGTTVSFRSASEKKYWRNNREISPPPRQCLVYQEETLRVHWHCQLTQLTIISSLLGVIYTFLHVYLLVSFFLCVGFECFGGVDSSNDPLTKMKSCFPSFWNSESRKLHLAYCLPNSPRSRLLSWLPMQQLPETRAINVGRTSPHICSTSSKWSSEESVQ